MCSEITVNRECKIRNVSKWKVDDCKRFETRKNCSFRPPHIIMEHFLIDIYLLRLMPLIIYNSNSVIMKRLQ